ncbi:MAG: ABC transporter permease, partial [bacterium]|nr:ABC transporter permease [bacterium]
MLVENLQSIRPFWEWLVGTQLIDGALVALLGVLAFLLVAFCIFGWLVAAFRHGPVEGINVAGRVLIDSFWDLVLMSPRRVWAFTWLAIAEARRRYVIVIFVIFMVIMLFAGWYLDAESDQPAEVYLTFVLTSSSMLAIMLGLLLSAFSLPEDITNKTIYTVVTKPARSSEIIGGRILGFTLVGTTLLIVMGLASYVFVLRGLSHTHTIAEQAPGEFEGEITTSNNRHFHKIIRNGDLIVVEHAAGHTHDVEVQGDTITLSGPVNQLEARIPIYGEVSYRDKNGKDGAGISVGDEWDYRKYITGASEAAAIYKYEGVTVDRFVQPLTAEETAALKKSRAERTPKEQEIAQQGQRKQGLPLELDIGVFRTFKGDIVTRVRGQIVVRNPNPAKNLTSTPLVFVSEEFSKQQITIPRKLNALNGEYDLDLFDDFVENGEVEIIISCIDRGQYFGMGQFDVYLRAQD